MGRDLSKASEKRTVPMTIQLIRHVALPCILSLVLPATIFAAGGPATDLAARCEDLLQNGNCAKAAEVGEEFLNKYKTGGDCGPDCVFKVRYNVAWAYYMCGDYRKAIDWFNILRKEGVPSVELKEQATQMVGDSYSRYAGSLQEPKAKKDNYNEAIKTYSDFIKEFPTSASMADVLYGRGLAYFRIDKYDDSAKDLDLLLTKYPQSELALDAKYLLATVLGTHGSALRKDNKPEDAKKYLERARDLFKEIINSRDIALANDAAYAAGEIFIQLKEYDTAISYYRSVRTRDEVLASQEAKVNAIMRLFGDAVRAGQKGRADALRNLRMKENSKLQEIRSSPDLLLAAFMRIADSLFQQKRYDEARVMYQFLRPHAKLGDREVAKGASAQIVACQLATGRPELARQAFEEFESDHGAGDKLAEPFGLALGDLFLRKNKAEEALAALDKSLEDYKDSQFKPMVEFRKATALAALNRSEEARKLLDAVKSHADLKNLSDEVAYAMGKILRNLGEYDEAIKQFKLVLDKNPNFELADDVHFQIALCLKGKQEYDKAVEQLRKFIQTFEAKNSILIVPAAYQIGQCYEAKDDVENAVKAYRDLAAKYSSHQLAPFGLYQVGIVYYNKQKWEDMVRAFEELIQKFPKDALVCDSHFWIGFKFQNEKNWPKAVERFEKVVKDCHENQIAPDAQHRIGNAWQSAAMAMGNYKPQAETNKPIWRENVSKAIAAYEKLLADFPNATQLDTTLDGLTQLALDKIVAEVEKPSDVDTYFNKLSAQFSANPELAARVLFCLASVYYKLDKTVEAIGVFEKAFQGAGSTRLPPDYYDQYGQLLTDTKKFDQAIEVYLKMETEYKDDQSNVAHAVWGLGNAYLQAGLYDKAVTEFDRLIKDFPWHPHAADAEFGKGLVLESQGKFAEAKKIYEEVAAKLKGEARIRSLLGLGRCQAALGDCKSAVENFLKVALFYEKFGEFASEALWRAGECFEKLSTSNPAEKDKNLQSAIKAYRDLILKYPNSKFAEEAKKRLNALTGGK